MQIPVVCIISLLGATFASGLAPAQLPLGACLRREVWVQGVPRGLRESEATLLALGLPTGLPQQLPKTQVTLRVLGITLGSCRKSAEPEDKSLLGGGGRGAL